MLQVGVVFHLGIVMLQLGVAHVFHLTIIMLQLGVVFYLGIVMKPPKIYCISLLDFICSTRVNLNKTLCRLPSTTLSVLV